jgi:hypothetical protein
MAGRSARSGTDSCAIQAAPSGPAASRDAASREAQRGLVVALAAILLLVAWRLLRAAWDGV